MRTIWALAATLLLFATMAGAPAHAQLAVRAPQPLKPDVIYVPTPEPVVDAMLALAEVRPGDVLYDLGSGDGRIPIVAAKRFGVRGLGVEVQEHLVRQAREKARAEGVGHLVTFRVQDLFRTDLRPASVVTLYLLPDLNARLMPKLLAELKPGARIVSHDFPMGDWRPEREVKVGSSTLYLWRVPERGVSPAGSRRRPRLPASPG